MSTLQLKLLCSAAMLAFTADRLGAGTAVNKPDFQRSRTGEVYEIVAPLAAKAPTLEAGFNDPAWKDAKPQGSFRVVARTAFAKNQTLVWVVAGTDTLYLAVACEDDDIQATPGERNSNVAWTMDAVEWFFCPRRDNEQWFHFIFNAVGAQYNDIEGAKRDPKWQPAPDWQVVTARQPWGWTAVARIPYATMGLTEPAARGDIWKMKCIRTDLSKTGKIQSSWTRVAEAFDADSFSGGDLVFESRNFLANPLEHWRPGEPISDWKVTAGKGAVEVVMADSEPAGLFHWEPESAKVYWANFGFGGRGGYKAAPYDGIFRFTAKARLRPAMKEGSVAAYFRWYIGEEKPPYESVLVTSSTDFREYELQHAFKRGQAIYAPEFHTAGSGDIEIKDVVFKLDDRLLKKAGVHCLTKNAPPELARLNLDVGCRYTYRKAGTDADEFPYFTPHFGGPPSVVGFSEEGYTGSDGHRVGGWIPVKDGYLTDGLVGTGVGWGLYFYPSSGYDVVFDLGSDYLIDEVEIMAPGASIRNASLYLKSTNEARYVMTHTVFDLLAFNRSGYDQRGSVKFAGVNTGARWLRMNLVLGYGGFSEVRIWGRPFNAGEPQPAKIPYRQGGGKIVAENPKELPGLPEMTVFPLPQEIEPQQGNLSITPEMNIVIAGAGNDRARMTAEVLQEGLFTRTGLKLPIAAESRSAAIVLKENTSVMDKPEGYVLGVTPKGVVIAGKDPVGTFYGAQSLVQLLRSDEKGGWQIPCQRIRDWPATPIRYVQGSQAVTPELIRALARFKINYYEAQGVAGKANLAMAEKYCVKLAPLVQFNLGWCANPAEFSERTEGEDLAKLGVMRRNPCPSHPGMWEAYFKQMDAMIEASNSDIVNINADEMYHSYAGSRWNLCPRCRARNLAGHGLFVETLKKIQAHASARGKRFMMIDSIMNSKGISHPDDAANDWRKVPDLLPPEVKKDMIVYLWHATDPVYDALVKNHITMIRWSPNAGFVEQQGFPGPYSGFFLSQADGAMDVGQIIGMAQLCWSPERARGGGKDEQRFLELAAAALPMWNECLLNSLPPSRQAGRKPFCVDLAGAANASRVDDVPCDGKGWVDLGGECDLRALRPGLRSFAGIPFNVIDEQKNNGKSVVMVANRGAVDRVLPARVEFPVNRKAANLCLLHTLSQRAGWNYHTKDELCGYYFIVYEDDTCDPFEIKYAINAVNWDGKNTIWTYSPRGIALSRASLAWRGETRSGQTAALYAAEWINPRPQATIKKIIFASPQLKTPVKPILLAVTGFAVLPGDGDDASVDRKLRLRPAALLTEPKLPGAPIDLTEGKVESKRLYVTKDGIRLKTDSPFMQFSEINENYQGAVACVAFDNNQAVKGLNQNAIVVVELPEPRMLSGVGVAGQYRYEFYQNDFQPAIIDYSVEISPDGTTWEKIADVKGHIPEEEGLRTHAFSPRLLKAVRITARNGPGSHPTNWAGGQLAFIQLYEPEPEKRK